MYCSIIASDNNNFDTDMCPFHIRHRTHNMLDSCYTYVDRVGRGQRQSGRGISTAKVQHRKFETNISRKGIGWPQSHFSHSYVSVSDLYIPTIDLPILLQENRWTD